MRRVQNYSGLSERESKEALIMLVETLASRLDDQSRRDFASELPEQLQDIALSVYPAVGQRHYDIIAQFMYYQNIGKLQAKQQISAARQALADAISEDEMGQIDLLIASEALAHSA